MNIIAPVGLFLLGTAVGSFVNVLVLRFKVASIYGRSFCLSCGRTLCWYELIPIVSFMALCGRCRTCKTRISFQYPIVEIIFGLVFLILFLSSQSFVEYIFAVIFFSILIFAGVYDWLHKIIPEEALYGASFLAVLFLFYNFSETGFVVFYDALAGVFLAFPLLVIFLLSGGRAMGLGDPKIMFPIGTFLGIVNGVSALLVAFWSGAVFSLLLLLKRSKILSYGDKPLTMKSEIPLAPFLVAGAFVAFVFDLDITRLASFL